MKNPSEIWSKLITTWLDERERPADTIQKMEEFYFKNSKNVSLEFARNIIDVFIYLTICLYNYLFNYLFI